MIRKTQVAVWFLLFSFLLSIGLCSASPLSSIHGINTKEKQKEQIIKRERESIDKRGRQANQDARKEVDVSSPRTLYFLKWKDGDGEDGLDLSKRVHSFSNPHFPTIPVRGSKVGIQWTINNISTTPNATTPTAAAIAATATTTATNTVIHSFLPFPLYYPPSPFSVFKSSSCASPACKWLASWQFMAVICMTLAWLVTLMTLSCMTKTTRGQQLLEACLSLCTQDEKYHDKVLTKGIGYFDGSPGLRRFVLIEDEKDEGDEEDDRDDLSTSELKDVRSRENEEAESEESGGGDRISKNWKPPRRGTYILQEASMKDVLEVGTYRLQEEEEEEEEEEKVYGKKKGKDEKDEEVEYILEGATYILRSERIERGTGGGEGGGYGYIGGIEGLYGIVGRDGLHGEEYGRMRGLGVYGIIGGEVGGKGVGRYGRVEGIEGLYEILQNGGGEGDIREGGGGDDDVLLSVGELLGTVGGRGRREERVREESTNGGRRGAEGKEWREVGGGRGAKGGKHGEGSKGGRRESGGEKKGREVRERRISVAKREQGGRGVTEKGRERDEKEGEIHISGTWKGGKRGGVTARLGGTGEGGWGSRTTPSPKRAASFPMDHFLSSHLRPRKLSLIVEEETH